MHLLHTTLKHHAQVLDHILCSLSAARMTMNSTAIRHANICHRSMPVESAEQHKQVTVPYSAMLGVDNRSLYCGRTVLRKVFLWHKKLNLVRHMSGSVLSKFTKDIDLEKLREEAKREMRKTGQNMQLIDKVRELVAQKCAETIANYTEEEKKKLQVIQLEHNFLYSEGYDIPSPDLMKDELWVEAMALSSKSQRLKYYLYIQKKKYIQDAEREKRAAHKEEMKNREKQEEYEHGRIFMRIYEQTMRRWLNYGLARAMLYGTPLVFDMDYVDHMRPQEQKNTAHQLHDAYCLNRGDPAEDPFHLHFTGCSPNNPVLKLMQIKTQDSPLLLNTVTEKSYIDLFDKDKLVYLSPQGRQVMTEFDPEAVYIIGAFNDKVSSKPVSYARAMEQGIRCQRLPIDEHLSWNQGTKNLTLDQMMKIMLDVKRKLPWKVAFKAIPKRKLR
ncbi:ribonuclease hi [Plakobranchus ocellatus]|uniref:RNA (guanine-9-)-methyltransferase domain-containing protein 1 n=1 Tax=Plakobranchus ocellatus TaxID=259542 RepID=A0AAV4DL58_9GAST|nr:ribonuclease hi [Plakobranchus ocellatus]